MSYLRLFALLYLYLGALCFIWLIESFFWDEYNKYFNRPQPCEQYQLKALDLPYLPTVPVADGRRANFWSPGNTL